MSNFNLVQNCDCSQLNIDIQQLGALLHTTPCMHWHVFCWTLCD